MVKLSTILFDKIGSKIIIFPQNFYFMLMFLLNSLIHIV